jgi:hypothetical protein
MKALWYVPLFLIGLPFQTLIAQDEWGRHGPGGPDHERFAQFRKMKLIEVLELNEDESVRFFAKQAAHEKNMHALMQSRNEALDGVEKSIHDKGDGKALDQNADKILELDKKMFEERRRFEDELRHFLSPDRFAKFLVFERNFGRDVRNAMRDMYHERMKGRDHEQ